MTRPGALPTGLIAIPGWLAATSTPDYGRMAAMVAAVMVGRAIANIFNDILDREKDRVTGPELPLPSGLVTLRQATLTAGALTLCLLVLLWIAGGGWNGFLVNLVGIVGFGSLFIGLYSLVKARAPVAVALTGCVYLCPLATAWLVAGGGWSPEVCVVFAYGLLRGFAANVFSTYRDVERDGEVGNLSIAVRLGESRAFALGIAIEVAAIGCILVIAQLRGEPLRGMVVVAGALSLYAFASIVTVRQMHAPPELDPRRGRSLMIWPLAIARNHVWIVLVQSPPVALVAVLITAVFLLMEFLIYEPRLVRGGLRQALAATRLVMTARAP
jgi:4-hydroxybenzoate polyprenyltransferase